MVGKAANLHIVFVDADDSFHHADGHIRFIQDAALLFERRRAVRRLIDNFRTSTRSPFPNWKLGPVVATSSANISEFAAMISAPP